MESQKKLVTDKELHEIFPVLSVWAINNLRRRKILPYIVIPGLKKFVYDVSAVEKWLYANMKNQSVK